MFQAYVLKLSDLLWEWKLPTAAKNQHNISKIMQAIWCEYHNSENILLYFTPF